MPPKRGVSKARAGSVAAPVEDEDVAAPVAPSPARGSVSLLNKSGPPELIIAKNKARDPAYSPSSQYMSGTVISETPEYQAPDWVVYWLTISATVMLIDAGYSWFDGDSTRLPWFIAPIAKFIWQPWATRYSTYDMFYASDAAYAKAVCGIEEGNGARCPNAFGPSQTLLNFAEIVLQYIAVLLSLAKSPSGSIYALVVSVATCAKTILYFVMAWQTGWYNVIPIAAKAAADPSAYQLTYITEFLIPNGIWIVVPALVVFTLGSKLAEHAAMASTYISNLRNKESVGRDSTLD